MPISAGVSAGGSLLGGLFSSKAAKSAAATQEKNAQNVAGLATTAATNAQTGVTDAANTGANSIAGATTAGQNNVAEAVTGANSTLQNYLNTQLAGYQPYQQTGTQSLAGLQQLTGPNGPLSQQFSAPTTAQLNDPNNPMSAGYQFTLQQGQQALARSAAAQGNLFSTGTAKSLANYTTGTANQYYQNAYNNALTTFNTNRQGTLSQIAGLQSLAGLGSTATQGASAAIGQNAGLQSSNTLSGGEYGANLGLSGTEAGAGMTLAGAQSAGQFGLQGATIAGQALTGGANAQAAGTQGAANAWVNALQNGSNAFTQYSTLNALFPNGVPNGSLAGAGGYSNPNSYQGAAYGSSGTGDT